jgi:hypothetical protein
LLDKLEVVVEVFAELVDSALVGHGLAVIFCSTNRYC